MTDEPLDQDLHELLGAHPRTEVTTEFEHRVVAAARALEVDPRRPRARAPWLGRVAAGAAVAMLGFAIGRFGSPTSPRDSAGADKVSVESIAEFDRFVPAGDDTDTSSISRTWREIQFIEQAWGF